jgi:hypothetical protein
LLVPAAALGMAVKGSSGKSNNKDNSLDSNSDANTEGKG